MTHCLRKKNSVGIPNSSSNLFLHIFLSETCGNTLHNYQLHALRNLPGDLPEPPETLKPSEILEPTPQLSGTWPESCCLSWRPPLACAAGDTRPYNFMVGQSHFSPQSLSQIGCNKPQVPDPSDSVILSHPVWWTWQLRKESIALLSQNSLESISEFPLPTAEPRGTFQNLDLSWSDCIRTSLNWNQNLGLGTAPEHTQYVMNSGCYGKKHNKFTARNMQLRSSLDLPSPLPCQRPVEVDWCQVYELLPTCPFWDLRTLHLHWHWYEVYTPLRALHEVPVNSAELSAKTSSSCAEEGSWTEKILLALPFPLRPVGSEMNAESYEIPAHRKRDVLDHSWKIQASNAAILGPWFAWSAKVFLIGRSGHRKHAWKPDRGFHEAHHQQHHIQFWEKAGVPYCEAMTSRRHNCAISTCISIFWRWDMSSDIWSRIPALLQLLPCLPLHRQPPGLPLEAGECSVPNSPPPGSNCRSHRQSGLFQRDRLGE